MNKHGCAPINFIFESEILISWKFYITKYWPLKFFSQPFKSLVLAKTIAWKIPCSWAKQTQAAGLGLQVLALLALDTDMEIIRQTV